MEQTKKPERILLKNIEAKAEKNLFSRPPIYSEKGLHCHCCIFTTNLATREE